MLLEVEQEEEPGSQPQPSPWVGWKQQQQLQLLPLPLHPLQQEQHEHGDASGYGKNTRQQHRLRYLIQTTPSHFITSVLNRYSECVLQSLENHVHIHRKRGIFTLLLI